MIDWGKPLLYQTITQIGAFPYGNLNTILPLGLRGQYNIKVILRNPRFPYEDVIWFAHWNFVHFHYNENTEISVFPGPKTQDSRFSEKVSPEILSLVSWDHKILKFQYFTEISVFPRSQDPRLKIFRKSFP